MKSILLRVLTAGKNHDWRAVVDLAQTLEASVERAPVSSERDVFLVTGGAGFIGSHLTRRLLRDGHHVIVFDDFNDYYDPVLKYENVADFLASDSFELREIDVRDLDQMRACLDGRRIHVIVHLAARAGVRPSVADPQLYVTTNVLGTQNMLDVAREHAVESFVYASSSSVYGESGELQLRETQRIDDPISPYAATKRANEGQAACYSHLYRFPVVGLRFFSVYGPSGRPDMAIRQFIEKLDRGEPVTVYGDGSFERDFTYIDDAVSGILCAIDAARGRPGYNEVFNLGESDTTSVRELILLIARELGLVHPARQVKALSRDELDRLLGELAGRGLIQRLPEQPGDVHRTCADISKSREMLGYSPRVSITDGIQRTVAWHRARKDESQGVFRPHLADAVRAYLDLQCRSAMDRFGRRRDPDYAPDDAALVLRVIERLPPMNDSVPDSALARHTVLGFVRLLGEISTSISACGSR